MENFSEKKIIETSFRGTSNKLDIIFENEKFIAINKPSGLLTIPDRHNELINSLYKTLQFQYQKLRLLKYFQLNLSTCQFSRYKALLFFE